MLYFIHLFTDRKNEIDEFLNLMLFLERKNEQRNPGEDVTSFQKFFHSADDKVLISYQSMINIMKSNIALMIYNIIEFTISGLIDNVYEAIKNQELSYVDVNNDIQRLWRKTILNATKDPNANHNTILKKNEEMIDHILQRKTLELSARDYVRSGNLDGIEIMKTLESHGITFSSSNNSYRPERLSFIKTKRNELAHGSISFTEALRDNAMNDICTDRDTIFSFLEDLIEVFKHYHDISGYRCAN